MCRLTLVAPVMLMASWVTAAEPTAVKVIARGPWPHLPIHTGPMDRDIHQRVIRSAEELTKAAGVGGSITVPKALKVDGIDFKTQMLIDVEDGSMPLVGVSGAGPPSSPATVSITRIDKTDKTLTVSWQRIPPPKGILLTRPAEAVLVDHFDGEVKFRRLDKDSTVEPGGTEVKPIARAMFPDGWPPDAPPTEWVVRSAAELIDSRLRAPEPVLERMRQDALARYAKALKVDAIDFGKQMIVGVSAGVQPAGSRVEVTKVERDAKETVVHWRLHGPKADTKPTAVEHPAEVVLVEQMAGPVRFKREK